MNFRFVGAAALVAALVFSMACTARPSSQTAAAAQVNQQELAATVNTAVDARLAQTFTSIPVNLRQQLATQLVQDLKGSFYTKEELDRQIDAKLDAKLAPIKADVTGVKNDVGQLRTDSADVKAMLARVLANQANPPATAPPAAAATSVPLPSPTPGTVTTRTPTPAVPVASPGASPVASPTGAPAATVVPTRTPTPRPTGIAATMPRPATLYPMHTYGVSAGMTCRGWFSVDNVNHFDDNDGREVVIYFEADGDVFSLQKGECVTGNYRAAWVSLLQAQGKTVNPNWVKYPK